MVTQTKFHRGFLDFTVVCLVVLATATEGLSAEPPQTASKPKEGTTKPAQGPAAYAADMNRKFTDPKVSIGASNAATHRRFKTSQGMGE